MITTTTLFLSTSLAALPPQGFKPPAAALQKQHEITLTLEVIRELKLGLYYGSPWDFDITDTDVFAVGLPSNVCTTIAGLAARAGMREVEEDLIYHLANCLNLPDPKEVEECMEEAWEEFEEASEENLAVYDARIDLCDMLGEADGYHPEIDPKDFVKGVNHPYYPLTPGTTLKYFGETEDGYETIEVTTTEELYEVLGVECVVVRDIVTFFEEEGDPGEEPEGEVIEDTRDYYAQDKDGNVWYFGEHTFELEDGFISSLDGQWIGGVDFAQPGIIMWADLEKNLGTTYRQEFALDEAEDAATLLSLEADVEIDFGKFDDCVQTHDFTPLEPDASEWKFYAEGIGTVREVNPDTGEEVVLVDIIVDGE